MWSSRTSSALCRRRTAPPSRQCGGSGRRFWPSRPQGARSPRGTATEGWKQTTSRRQARRRPVSQSEPAAKGSHADGRPRTGRRLQPRTPRSATRPPRRRSEPRLSWRRWLLRETKGTARSAGRASNPSWPWTRTCWPSCSFASTTSRPRPRPFTTCCSTSTRRARSCSGLTAASSGTFFERFASPTAASARPRASTTCKRTRRKRTAQRARVPVPAQSTTTLTPSSLSTSEAPSRRPTSRRRTCSTLPCRSWSGAQSAS
mmetsp:Transcript_23065/g.87225  ORF Transcript_23065/g.87225 Transcript_23065/m.87225 type:complete len:260 (-) Transcript_23065:2491-3270(-)